MIKLMGKKIFTILRSKVSLAVPMGEVCAQAYTFIIPIAVFITESDHEI